MMTMSLLTLTDTSLLDTNNVSGSSLLRWQHHKHCSGYYYYYRTFPKMQKTDMLPF